MVVFHVTAGQFQSIGGEDFAASVLLVCTSNTPPLVTVMCWRTVRRVPNRC